jgi:hypothetical protein
VFPGVTLVRLFVHDPSGNAGEPDAFNVTAVDTRPPVIRPMSDLDLTLGEEAHFDAGEVTDNDPAFGSTGTIEWQFRDGLVLRSFQGLRVNYTFAGPGSVRVDLAARDSAGNTARANFTVRVFDRTPPEARAAVPAAAFIGEPVEFNATGSTDNVQVVTSVWSFDPPTEVAVLNGARVRWTFGSVGNYTVALRIADAAGNTAVLTFHLEVKALPAPPPPPPPPSGTGTNGTQAQAGGDGALTVVGAALSAASAAGAVMLYRRWRRGPA